MHLKTASWLVLLISLILSNSSIAKDNDKDIRLREYMLDIGGVSAADISPDGRLLAVHMSYGSPSDVQRTDEIHLWDWRKNEIVAKRIVLQGPKQPPESAATYAPRYFVKFAARGSKLIVYGEGRLVVYNSTTLDTLQEIDLGQSHWPPPRIFDNGWVKATEGSYVADVEIDSAGQRAAVLIRWAGYSGAELRAYDLESGNLLRRWGFKSTLADPVKFRRALSRYFVERPIGIDNAGQTIAISLAGFAPEDPAWQSKEREVLIIDVDTGKLKASVHTGSLADSVCFSSLDGLSLVTIDFFMDEQKNRRAFKVWNTHTGALVREIAGPRKELQGYVDISDDGSVILGCSRHYRTVIDWEGWRTFSDLDHQNFLLFDWKTGKIIASSSQLWPKRLVQHLRFQLSPKGDIALVYADGEKSLYLYERK